MAGFLTLSASLLASFSVTCEDAIIGAGWAGVYFAYRRFLSSGCSDCSHICIFEATQRIGGRTYSVPGSRTGTPFTLDVGAYRFSPDMHLPGDLILEHFKLPTACYEPGCPPAQRDFPKPFIFNYTQPLLRIVDPETELPSGYATPLHHMLTRMADAGVQVFLGMLLTDIKVIHHHSVQLSFANHDKIVLAKTAMLNLPRAQLLGLPSLAHALPARTLDVLRCNHIDSTPLDPSLGNSTSLAKAYMYYEDAWWHTRINLTVGAWPANAFHPLSTSEGVFIGVRWNDGPVRCQDQRGVEYTPHSHTAKGFGDRCHGFLEIYYASVNEFFYYNLSGAPKDPLGVVRTQTPSGRASIELAHSALLEAIAPLLAKASVDPSSLPHPTRLVVGVWSHLDRGPHPDGYTAPSKVYWSPTGSGSLAAACSIPDLTPDEYRQTVLQPFGRDAPIFLANNDWVAQDVTYVRRGLIRCLRRSCCQCCNAPI